MAGGPSTVELATAVSDAGGLGFLAAGYRAPEDLRSEIRAMRGRMFGVNLFVPGPHEADDEAVRRYVDSLGPDAGDPRWDDDAWRQKLDVLRDEEPVPVLSFTFGCPPMCELKALRAHGSEVWVTVTSVEEAQAAVKAGADALVVQGSEAGGHRGTWTDHEGAEGEAQPLLDLLPLIAAVDVPLIATGGIATNEDVRKVMDAGAAAVQVGTAFMLAPEAGTNPAHREAIKQADARTAYTRAFTGRLARGIENRFMSQHPDAPIAYPQIHYATAPLRAAARKRNDADGFNLWAGTNHAQAMERPAAETVRALSPR